MNLLAKKCIPCEGGVPPIEGEELKKYLSELQPGWAVSPDGKKIHKEYKLKDFKAAMVLVNKIADLAEAENHHPDIAIFYSRVNITLWTHAIMGLSENDFILAAKINKIALSLKV